MTRTAGTVSPDLQPIAEPAAGAPVGGPVVSVVIIFLNAERFLREAVGSVLAQTYQDWELLLIDDGSSDGSTTTARDLAARDPTRIRYLEHDGHANRGMSASRNLGIQHASGRYVAFLDADDVWRPTKLAHQVPILDSRPDVAMLYGRSLYWYSWTGRPEDRGRDVAYPLGVPRDQPMPARDLLNSFFLEQSAAIPGPSSVVVRRDAALRIGGFEEEFTGAYEDQVFYAKLALLAPVIASEECLDLYRQHPERDESSAAARRRAYRDRLRFLAWLSRHLAGTGAIPRAGWIALRRDQWRCRVLFHAMPFEQGTRAVWSAARRILRASAYVRQSLSLRGNARQSVSPRTPRRGSVRFGDLRRLVPISRQFGFDRGRPIDRYYIERFLGEHAADVRGRVLEIEDDAYTRRFGGDRVTAHDVLHVVEGNPRATIVGDLRRREDVPANRYDCMIVTQTLQFIDDAPAAVQTIHGALRPGGVVLATLAGIGQVSRYDAEHWGYFDSATTASARRLFEGAFPPDRVAVRSYGNVLSAAAFLYGLATEEFSPAELDHVDDDYQVIVAVRAVKPSG